MSSLDLSLIQMESVHSDPEVNLARIEAWVEREKRCGADLMVFFELVTTGYLEPVMPGEECSRGIGEADSWVEFIQKFAALAEPIPGPTTRLSTGIACRLEVGIAVGALEALPHLRGPFANTVVAIDPNGVAGYQHKSHMPWNEKHVFMPGNELSVFNLQGVKVGINVCYDAYFPEQTRALALLGAELIISCFAGPARPDAAVRIPNDRAAILSRTRAMKNAVYFAAVNRVGQHGDFHCIGNSAVADPPEGSLVASTDSLGPAAIRAQIDVHQVTSARCRLPLLRDRSVDRYGDLCRSWEDVAKRN